MNSISHQKLLSLLGIGLTFLLSNCGGDGRNEEGFAPETLTGLTLHVVPEGVTSGVSPGSLNITAATASQGYINSGDAYTGQIIYSKFGPNEAKVSVAMHTPENLWTPTTVTFQFGATMTFTQEGRGVITEWSYSRHQEDSYYITKGEGNAGTVYTVSALQ